MSRLSKNLLRLILALPVGLGVAVIFGQDMMIFPGASFQIWGTRVIREKSSLPHEVESSFLESDDGGKFEVWRLEAEPRTDGKRFVGLLFHGNGEHVDGFFGYQKWFQGLGITTYSMEYRGYGFTPGWPSESGINRDQRVLWKAVTEREKIPPAQVVVFGVSLGTGPGTYLASLIQPKALVLVAPYTSLDNVARDRGFLGYFTPFLWNHFPSERYIRTLRDTCVIAMHGQRDGIILPHHSVDLAGLYQGRAPFVSLTDAESGHANIFSSKQRELEQALNHCLAS